MLWESPELSAIDFEVVMCCDDVLTEAELLGVINSEAKGSGGMPSPEEWLLYGHLFLLEAQ